MSSRAYAVAMWVCCSLQRALGIVNLFIWLSLTADELSCLIIKTLKWKRFLNLQDVSCVFNVMDRQMASWTVEFRNESLLQD